MSAGKGGSGPSQPTISTYSVGLQLVLAHGPFDKMTELFYDDKLVYEGNYAGGYEQYVEALDLLGGPDREGGVAGNIELVRGYNNETPNTYLEEKMGSSIPAYRYIATLIMKQIYIGNNYYMKAWSTTCQRIHKTLNVGTTQWQDALAEPTPGNMNAVHIIRELLTDPIVGYGYGAGEIDETDFAAAAVTCYNEGLGFSFLWEEESLEDFIDLVLDHIKASLYRDRLDGTFHIKLIRKVTSTSGLITVNDSNSSTVSNFFLKSIGSLVSSVIIKYTDKETWKSATTIPIMDIALQQRQSVPVEKTINYPGVTEKKLAQQLGYRDLYLLSAAPYSCTIECNRTVENLNVGDPFIFDRPDIIPTVLTMRVVSINLGTSTNGKITLDCIQDIFQAADLIYSNPPSSAWVSPINVAIDAPYRLLNETPYYLVAQYKGDSYAQSMATTDSSFVMAVASPTPDSISAGLWVDSGAGYVQRGGMDFCFTALVASPLNKVQTTLYISNIIDLNLLSVDHFIQVGSELMAVTAKTSTTLTVVRGVLDTYPTAHVVGERMFGWHDFGSTDATLYLLAENINVKVTPVTGKGELPLASATANNITIAGRMHRPYPPGKLTINGVYWPSYSLQGINIPITWAHRNRFQQTAGLTDYYAASITTEASVTYSVTLKRTDTLATLYSATGITIASDTIVPTSYIGQVLLEVWSVNPNGDSFQKVSHVFDLLADILYDVSSIIYIFTFGTQTEAFATENRITNSFLFLDY